MKENYIKAFFTGLFATDQLNAGHTYSSGTSDGGMQCA